MRIIFQTAIAEKTPQLTQQHIEKRKNGEPLNASHSEKRLPRSETSDNNL